MEPNTEKKQENKPNPKSTLTKADLEILKLNKEIEKIDFDLKESKKPWVYKNLGILIPTVLGLATVLTGVFNGYFTDLDVKLKNEQTSFTSDTTVFRRKRDSLHLLNNALQKNNDLLTHNTQVLKAKAGQLSNELEIASLLNKRQLAILDSINLRTKLLLLQNIKMNISDIQMGEDDDALRPIVNLDKIARYSSALKGIVLDTLEYQYQKYKHPLATRETEFRSFFFLFTKCIISKNQRDYNTLKQDYRKSPFLEQSLDLGQYLVWLKELGLPLDDYTVLQKFLRTID